MSCWWSRNGWQSIRFEIGAIILCQQFVLCWSGVSCVTNHFCVSGVSLIFFRSLPPSYLTHFSPLCTTYFHAVSQLAARSPLLLGNFRKAILVHCLGLDWSGPRECGRGVCVCMVYKDGEEGCVRGWEYAWELFDFNDPCGRGNLSRICGPMIIMSLSRGPALVIYREIENPVIELWLANH